MSNHKLEVEHDFGCGVWLLVLMIVIIVSYINPRGCVVNINNRADVQSAQKQ